MATQPLARDRTKRGCEGFASHLLNVRQEKFDIGPSTVWRYHSTMNWSECPEVERNPKKVSGAWLFRRTRLPVATFCENLNDGASIDDIFEWFPGVRRDQLEAVLSFTASTLKEQAA